MFFKTKLAFPEYRNARRKAIRTAVALPPDQQSLAAVYALGIRDGLQIAADIRTKTRKPERIDEHA